MPSRPGLQLAGVKALGGATAAYMSPEQARGKSVDKRTDIWAFGCIFFEMLTGKAAFPGKDVTDILAALIRSEPEWNSLPANLHWRLRETVESCLKKDAEDRYHDIADVRLGIQKVLAEPSGVSMPGVLADHRTKLRTILPWVAAALHASKFIFCAGRGSGGTPRVEEMKAV